MNLTDHLRRQMAWSIANFGPGDRRKGVIDHIRKELDEIENDPDHGDASYEWLDVIILGFDGLWRELHHQGVSWRKIPGLIVSRLLAKHDKNEQRVWPDWRTQPKDRAIEHDRSHD